MDETLGDFLSQLRTGAGLTIPDVVKALGVPRETAYSWERHTGRPEPESLGALLDLYRATDEQRLRAWGLRAAPRRPPETAAAEAA